MRVYVYITLTDYASMRSMPAMLLRRLHWRLSVSLSAATAASARCTDRLYVHVRGAAG